MTAHELIRMIENKKNQIQIIKVIEAIELVVQGWPLRVFYFTWQHQVKLLF